jgi:NAD(P)-dependent dehydrogenase (short-subunit alcohol dehydrogenase family)
MNAKNFLITGVSQGLGRAFAEAALAAGHRGCRHGPQLDALLWGLAM